MVEAPKIDTNPYCHPPYLQILNCPFCGGISSPERNWRHVWVECDTCDARGPKIDRRYMSKAIEIWNKRV